MKFNTIPADKIIMKTAKALEANGFKVMIAKDGVEAKKMVLSQLPKGAEVFNMNSETLRTTGIAEAINESGDYDSVRNKFAKLDAQKQAREKRQLGAAPDWTIGSVHAVTQEGSAMIASKTGSQLPAYASGAAHVIWVVGAQKIVKDIPTGFRRIYEHSLPLENIRAKKAYGEASAVNKILIVNKEVAPGRFTMILVKEVLGF